MVFQRPNPFPKSIFDNIAYGVQVNGLKAGRSLRDIVEHSLKRAALWDEVKDKLHQSAYGFRAASSSACASRARWRWIRKSCCSTNPARRSTRSPPPRSKI